MEMIDFYNKERIEYINSDRSVQAKDFVKYDSKKISWSDMFLSDLSKNIEYVLKDECLCETIFRPFQKQNFCYQKDFIQRTYQQTKLFPTYDCENMLICISGIGGNRDFSCLISNSIVDYQTMFNGQCFPLYWYKEKEDDPKTAKSFFDDDSLNDKYIRHDGVSDFIFNRAKEKYGDSYVRTKEDIFYYVYGILHEKTYREKFANDLKKMLPRIPLVSGSDNFRKFRDAGHKLAELHLNYETLNNLGGVTITGEDSQNPNNHLVTKMKFDSNGKEKDRTTIIYNDHIKVSNIPLFCYDYIVNGRSAIEWVMEQYQISTDKKSGITNDPNDWAREHDEPRYILTLLLSVIHLSYETVKIVNSLPKVDWDKE